MSFDQQRGRVGETLRTLGFFEIPLKLILQNDPAFCPASNLALMQDRSKTG